MANTLRNIQTLLRHDDSKLYKNSTLNIQIKATIKLKDSYRIGWCWNWQRMRINPLLFQKLRSKVIFYPLIYNFLNFAYIKQANPRKTIKVVSSTDREQTDQNNQLRYHEF